MKLKTQITVTLLIGLLPALASRADVDGGFTIRGAGLLSCAVYTEEREKRSSAYYMIGGWLDGYITAINQYAPDTYDVASFESTELFTAIMDSHCQDNPEDRLFSVVNTLVTRITDDRLRTGSPFVNAQVGDRTTQLYQTVVRRMQAKLLSLGFYEGESTGQVDSATQAAVARFQESIDFNPTGFPDQMTLWRLLRRDETTVE